MCLRVVNGIVGYRRCVSTVNALDNPQAQPLSVLVQLLDRARAVSITGCKHNRVTFILEKLRRLSQGCGFSRAIYAYEKQNKRLLLLTLLRRTTQKVNFVVCKHNFQKHLPKVFFNDFLAVFQAFNLNAYQAFFKFIAYSVCHWKSNIVFSKGHLKIRENRMQIFSLKLGCSYFGY